MHMTLRRSSFYTKQHIAIAVRVKAFIVHFRVTQKCSFIKITVFLHSFCFKTEPCTTVNVFLFLFSSAVKVKIMLQ